MGKGKRLRSGGRRERGRLLFDIDLGGPDLADLPRERPDTSGCPVGDRCEGCGGTDRLGITFSVSAFGRACATTCRDCDGRSLLTMLGIGGLRERVAVHARH